MLGVHQISIATTRKVVHLSFRGELRDVGSRMRQSHSLPSLIRYNTVLSELYLRNKESTSYTCEQQI